MKNILTFILLTIIIYFIFSTPRQVFAEENNLSTETKSYCKATLDYDFADNRVLVVLNQTSTMRFKEYTPLDFPETKCLQVNDSNEYAKELVQKQLKSQRNGSLKIQDSTNIESSINIDDFRTILTLELAEKSKENVLETIKRLEQRDDILSVEPDYRMSYYAAPSPTPTLYSNQWAIEKIQLPLAWDITTGSDTVVVGVMDSGINGSHPDLKDRIATNLCGSFTTGKVAVANPTDSDGHGTQVAGIIGAQRNSGTPGITGVGWNIKVASLQINNPDESKDKEPYVSSVIRALQFAKDKGIPIINLSSGYDAPRGTDEQKSALEQAISDYGGLFVCAAGNGTNGNGFGKSNDLTAIYPSNFNLPNLISVGSTDNNDSISSFSNYGTSTVDLFAPGYDIVSTNKENKYIIDDGTSFAAPHVAGVAALMKSINPNLTPTQIKKAIINNVDKASASGTTGLSTLYGKCVSNGRLNAFKAVRNVAFQLNSSGDTITGLNFTCNGELTIPDSIYDAKITSIGILAFANQPNLTSVVIPSSVKSISLYAFNDCTNLSSVSIPSTTNVTYPIFSGCTKLYGTITSINMTQHRIITSRGELNWENHNFSAGKCTTCEYQHTHTEGTYYGEPHNHHTNCTTCDIKYYCDEVAPVISNTNTTHTYSCNECTYTKTEAHNYSSNQICITCGYVDSGTHKHLYTYSYLQIPPGKFSCQHRAYCACMAYVTRACVGLYNPPNPTTCGDCGQLMPSGGLGGIFSIELPSGDILVSQSAITYEVFLEYSKHLGHSYSLSDYLNSNGLILDNTQSINTQYYIPKKENDLLS